MDNRHQQRPFASTPTGPAGLPRLGVSLSFQSRPDLDEPFDRAYREGIEFAAEADRAGIDDIWLSEHHGEADGYCPSPIVAAAAVAAATKHARIHFGIALAPLAGHPLRMAEDLAVLDNLSGGRVELGFGQGYREHEFEAFGLDYARRTRAFAECLDVVDLAWRGEPFDYAGDIHRVKNGVLRPAPVRPGAPALWLGAATPASRARAVRRRAGLMIASLTTIGHTARQFASFDEETAAAGGTPLPHAVAREIEAADSDEDARRAVAPWFDHIYRVQYSAERTGMTRIDPNTGTRVALRSDDPYYLSPEFMNERWAIGSVETCATQIASWLSVMRLERLVFHAKFPGRPLDESVDAMRVVVERVWPRVQALVASPQP